MAETNECRGVLQVVAGAEVIEGAGVRVRRAFPTQAFDYLDPFLLLDQMGPVQMWPGKATGFPEHPHRGFETVTYLLKGQMEHRDSFGNRGLLNPGDVQWMTAGAGLVHSEMPGPDLVASGGTLHGFQLWVNLPRRDKMAKPSYQELKGEQIPAAESPDGKVKVKVIAGEALGRRAAIGTHTPIFFLHFMLAPGGRWVQAAPRSHNAMAWIIEGEASFGSALARAGELVVFARDADCVEISNGGGGPLGLLLIGGEPIGEPVARYGPFVMNTREEVAQAFEDFRSGKMGTIRRA
jgi:redox-sensitive bicupin YhaK (pirin superfamily)